MVISFSVAGGATSSSKLLAPFIKNYELTESPTTGVWTMIPQPLEYSLPLVRGSHPVTRDSRVTPPSACSASILPVESRKSDSGYSPAPENEALAWDGNVRRKVVTSTVGIAWPESDGWGL